MRKSLLFCVSFLILLFGLTECSKDTNESIILLGTEYYVTPLEEIIPDSLWPKLSMMYGGFNEGFIPPNIEGEYVINKKYCTSNFVDLSDDQDLHIRITNQHNRVACVDFYEGGVVRTDTAFVMGTGSDFSLYFVEERRMSFLGSHSMVTRCVFFSGKKEERGVKDLYYGNVILAATRGDNPFLGTFIPGWYFVYKDEDGVSENSNWLGQNGKGIDHE